MTTKITHSFHPEDKSSYYLLSRVMNDTPPRHEDVMQTELITFSNLISYMEEAEPDNTEIRYEIAEMAIGDTLLKGFPQASWDGIIIVRIK